MRDNIGPEHCANCIDAFIHHTFVHYCYQCALLFPERHTPIPSHLLTNLTEECLWTYVPYMLGTRIQTIGFKHTNQEEEDRDNKEEDEEGLEGNLGSPEEEADIADNILSSLLLKQQLKLQILWKQNNPYETHITQAYEYDVLPEHVDTEEWVQSDYHKMLGIVYTYVLKKDMGGTTAEINRTIKRKDVCLSHMLRVLTWKDKSANYCVPNMTH